jgi:hypothetical protein
VRRTTCCSIAAGIAFTLSLSAMPAVASPTGPEHDLQGQNRSRDRDRDQDAAPERTERIERTFQVGPNGELDLSDMSGRITVTGSGDRDIRVVATKRVREQDEAEAARALAALDLDVMHSGSRVEIRTSNQRGRRRAFIDYDVTVPVATRVRLHTISGDIKATNLKGPLNVQSVSGAIAVDGVSGVGEIKSVSGDLTLGSIGSDGDLSIGSVSGEVIVRSIKGRGLDLQTVSGDIQLASVTCERASIRSVSGEIDYTGPLARGGRYEFKLHSGNIRLSPTNQMGFELRATSFSGEIQSDLPLTIQPGSGPQGDGRGPRTRTVRGIHGDGAALIDVTTFSGDVTITSRR